ncbi:uncharacterized protein LOC106869040 [Octopus bimaculoides]|uniref:C2H2-type domain-containing protein n=1 Tax=Octopus bimaculoides TaxID=37653 RepID=A0A0L8HRM2_OCTBM|nr:uncharacterized protein LOC106869040 [Octopus bimaculoides]|eukprot:XP_014770030.1 PREDICTED: uncharacterized protein LOC106869040 isoform X1 [Octopus bimaculoides]
MATGKLKGKPWKKSRKGTGIKGIYEPCNTERLDERMNGSVIEQTTYMSLDVLAQVAADTLQNSEKLQSKIATKKMSKRSIQCLDILNLEQIQMLSEKSLLNFFSEMTCNEMTRNFTYQCFLIPDKCCEKFTSFGNEAKAKLQIRQHLADHIQQLLDEANDTERKYRFIFTAEPVHVRQRRLSEMDKMKKRKSVCVNSSPLNRNNQQRTRPLRKTFTSLKASKEPHCENKVPVESANICDIDQAQILPRCTRSWKKRKVSAEKSAVPNQNGSCSQRTSTQKQLYPRKQLKNKNPPKCNKPNAVIPLLKSPNKMDAPAEGENNRTSFPHVDEDPLPKDAAKRIEENELFIVDLLNRTQPYLDHCYTTIFGKKRGIETFHQRLDADECNNNNNNSDNEENVDSAESDKEVVPILEFSLCNAGDVPEVSVEEIVDCPEILLASEDSLGHCGLKPYPPMPKSALAKKGKIQVPEEEESFSEGERNLEESNGRKSEDNENVIDDLERKTALHCIRELKARKKDEKISLTCQICLNKTFTASATLMYHYRSHAGIKPFVCLLCRTSFTRQHSLNYHMLIHNDQSRFTCKDCGRKFRHPSHFKEHLRRHTGETPFECKDCPQKFKTRNTYKRHLKTRHGKLLTATGIHVLSKEEFMKVRTKPYKKYQGVKDTEAVVGHVNVGLNES